MNYNLHPYASSPIVPYSDVPNGDMHYFAPICTGFFRKASAVFVGPNDQYLYQTQNNEYFNLLSQTPQSYIDQYGPSNFYSDQVYSNSSNHLSTTENSYVNQPAVSVNLLTIAHPVSNNQLSPTPCVSSEQESMKEKTQILEEIVRECNEIEKRSNSTCSPVSSWSSDDQDILENYSFYPYKTPEKKERKKAQNRLAATRYREKKRREKEEALTCIKALTVTNNKLKENVAELEREIRYFRKFMVEMGMQN